jgi:hypothetical protein
MGEAYCDIEWDYDEPQIYEKHIRKARKDHQCCECNEIIQVGQRYEHVKALWDGSFGEFKTCLICSRIRDDMIPGCPHIELDIHLEECFEVRL